MKISEVIEKINSGLGLPKTANEINVGRDRLQAFLHGIGYKFDQREKQWLADEVPPIINENIFDHVQPKGKRKPNNKRTEEPKSNKTNEPNTKPTKEGKSKMRKRASFDIDTELLKELKIFAIKEEKNAYEIVELAIQKYLREGRKL